MSLASRQRDAARRAVTLTARLEDMRHLRIKPKGVKASEWELLIASNHTALQQWMDTHYTATEQDVLKRRAEEEWAEGELVTYPICPEMETVLSC